MENVLRMLRRITSPVRKFNRADDEYSEYLSKQPRKKLFVIVGDGYRAGEKYAMDLSRAVAMYGDDLFIMYNNYRKAKQNGNFTDRNAIPKPTEKQRQVRI
jgi:hypothetical protein